MSLTQKVPSTALTLGDRTIRVPNQVVARAPSSAVNTLSDNQMSVPVSTIFIATSTFVTIGHFALDVGLFPWAATAL
jgi:hypothetical protein